MIRLPILITSLFLFYLVNCCLIGNDTEIDSDRVSSRFTVGLSAECHHLAIAPFPDSGFIVVWSNNAAIYGRVLRNNGTPETEIFQIGSQTGYDNRNPAIVCLNNATTAITWSGARPDTNWWGEPGYAQKYLLQFINRDGSTVNKEQVILSNKSGLASDMSPTIARLTDSSCIVIYNGIYQQYNFHGDAIGPGYVLNNRDNRKFEFFTNNNYLIIDILRNHSITTQLMQLENTVIDSPVVVVPYDESFYCTPALDAYHNKVIITWTQGMIIRAQCLTSAGKKSGELLSLYESIDSTNAGGSWNGDSLVLHWEPHLDIAWLNDSTITLTWVHYIEAEYEEVIKILSYNPVQNAAIDTFNITMLPGLYPREPRITRLANGNAAVVWVEGQLRETQIRGLIYYNW